MHEEATDGQLVCFSLRVLQARQLSLGGGSSICFFSKSDPRGFRGEILALFPPDGFNEHRRDYCEISHSVSVVTAPTVSFPDLKGMCCV